MRDAKPNTVFCIPEPQHGEFMERSTRHLIDWKTEYLDLASTHIYWLNTYWLYQNAINGANIDTRKYFADGKEANIGITVRFELGASFARKKFSNQEFSVIVGTPKDAQGLTWLDVQGRLLDLPIYRLIDKNKVLCENWYKAILDKIT